MKDKRIERGEETWSKIIEASIDLISEEGVAAISASKLSRRAGISKSTIFHHFESTAGIPLAVLNRITETMIGPFNDESAKTVEDLLDSIDRAFFHPDREYRKLVKVFFSFYNEGLFNPEYRILLRNFQAQSVHRLTEILLNNNRGNRGEEEVRSIAKLLIASMDGIFMHILLGHEKDDYTRCWNLQKKAVLHLLNNGAPL